MLRLLFLLLGAVLCCVVVAVVGVVFLLWFVAAAVVVLLFVVACCSPCDATVVRPFRAVSCGCKECYERVLVVTMRRIEKMLRDEITAVTTAVKGTVHGYTLVGACLRCPGQPRNYPVFPLY